MADYPRFRRRNYLVNWRTQLRFMSLLFLQMSFILACLAVFVYSHITRTTEIALAVPFVDAETQMEFQQEVIDHVHGFYMRSMVLIAMNAVIVIVCGLLASHRLAGPLVKLEGYLKALADGDYSRRIAFRRKDHLDEFAASINRMVASIADRRANTRMNIVNSVRRNLAAEPALERASLLAEMDKMVLELKEAV